MKLLVEHNGQKLEVKIGVYRDLSPAIYCVMADTGAIYSTLSLPAPFGVDLDDGEFIVKSWEEEGLWQAVKRWFINTGKWCNVGGIPTTPIYRIKKPKPVFVVLVNEQYKKTFWTRDEAQRHILYSLSHIETVRVVEDFIE